MEHVSVVLVFTNVGLSVVCMFREDVFWQTCKEKLCIIFSLKKISDGLFHFCCGSIYDNPFSLLFLAVSDVSEDSSDEENEDDDFSCVQFGSRYWRKRT